MKPFNTQEMFAAKTDTGLEFLCKEINIIPPDAIALDNDTYNALLNANTRGARLAIENGKAIAFDWQGHTIDLTDIAQDANFSKPLTPPTLKDQANTAVQGVQQQANMVTAMGETFGPQMKEYVHKLRAIIDGADTTSTTLPPPPASLDH